jgi:hypothetical protein
MMRIGEADALRSRVAQLEAALRELAGYVEASEVAVAGLDEWEPSAELQAAVRVLLSTKGERG